MSRWTELAALMRQAVAFGCTFQIEGDAVTRQGELPTALAQELDRYDDLLPEFLDVHADDRVAIAFFERLGVELVHIAEPDDIAPALEALDVDNFMTGLPIAIDIETASIPPPKPRTALLNTNTERPPA
jgi:hypothetical protein